MEYSIEIARPPRDVYELATDPLRFAEWQPDVVGARMLDGERFATTRRIGGSEQTTVQRIIRAEPPTAWAAQGIDGPLRAHAAITIEPLDGGSRSRVTFTLDLEGHGIGVPLAPLARRQARKAAPASYHRLKEILEGTFSAPQ